MAEVENAHVTKTVQQRNFTVNSFSLDKIIFILIVYSFCFCTAKNLLMSKFFSLISLWIISTIVIQANYLFSWHSSTTELLGSLAALNLNFGSDSTVLNISPMDVTITSEIYNLYAHFWFNNVLSASKIYFRWIFFER